eukprot:COSAG04_NODE_4900_length_1833_cov_1.789504_2_plen_152_part_00
MFGCNESVGTPTYPGNCSRMNGCDLPMIDPAHPQWSHSRHCTSFKYVQEYHQQLWAWRNSIMGAPPSWCFPPLLIEARDVTAGIIAMVVLPVGAGLSDSFGRKPILVFGALMTFKSLCANLVSSTAWGIREDPEAYILCESHESHSFISCV